MSYGAGVNSLIMSIPIASVSIRAEVTAQADDVILVRGLIPLAVFTTMCNNHQLMLYFGGLCVSDQTGL